ncbi:MAG: aconitate hydratase AcnA [Verrucomicrobiota bacterium]|jgi:aconitate hydratase|nr:aconitate hydratase AcnA [Verrucomicrobiota bacterium]
MPHAISSFATFEHAGKTVGYYRLAALESLRGAPLNQLPYVVRILLESALRNQPHTAYTFEHVKALACWSPGGNISEEIPYLPARVLFQDLTGVPCVVDLASLRSAVVRRGRDPDLIEPQVPVDLVVDHSVQIDCAGSPDALAVNMEIEFKRNRERYEFLRWGQNTFQKLRIVPPGVGICHQVNLEFLASGVRTETQPNGSLLAFPDTLVGTDSHTTMINGLGVLGWGVGGIEAEAAMLGQPIALLTPVVTGVRLSGRLQPGVTATDLALAATRLLREHNVVGQFVEYIGPGCSTLSPADRSVLANMAPEYGATTGFFPMDRETIAYLRMTGRSEEHCALVETYARLQGLFVTGDAPEPVYSRVIELDLASVVAAIAGPKRPHDFQPVGDIKERFLSALSQSMEQGGFGVPEDHLQDEAVLSDGSVLRHGSIAIASITSCTNTSNPTLLLAAGIVAKKAVERGLAVPPYVKTSLVPGSRVVTSYLNATGLLSALEALGFDVAAYGCGTCIGNSGPIRADMAEGIRQKDLVAAAVLSGNRNFEGRVHASCKANYLCSPPLVVAFALAGRVDLNLNVEPLGLDGNGQPVFLKDLWPSPEEINRYLAQANAPALYAEAYHDVNRHTPEWGAIPVADSPVFQWREDSTYIREAPFLTVQPPDPNVSDARILGLFGDFITTDHISPAGAIAKTSPAARYLEEHGVAPSDFNSYGSRRGNHEVMMRGTFANVRLRNRMASREGGWTRLQPSGEETSMYDAAMAYQKSGVPVVVIAGKLYGAGSSRDWAAKGPMLLGVRAVLAESFERIHRSNLVEMGILPLEFTAEQTAQSLGLDGRETLSIQGRGALAPNSLHEVTARKPDGTVLSFIVKNRIDTPIEIEYYQAGGILPYVLNNLLQK